MSKLDKIQNEELENVSGGWLPPRRWHPRIEDQPGWMAICARCREHRFVGPYTDRNLQEAHDRCKSVAIQFRDISCPKCHGPQAKQMVKVRYGNPDEVLEYGEVFV